MVVVAGLVGAAPAAAAVVPGNDTLAGATVIGTLPFEQTLDTTSATTDDIDVEANAACGAPVTLASVWYDYTATSDDALIIDVSQSNFPAGVIVVSGDPGSFYLENCGPGTIAVPTLTGVTYHIMAFSDTDGINGGILKISVQQAPPPPVISVSIDPVGRVNQKSGAVTLSGTFTCSGDGWYGEIDGTLTQRVGRFYISGMFYQIAPACDGTSYPWTAQLVGDNGRFAGGKSAAFAWAYECGLLWCSEGYAEQTVQLKR